MSAYRHRISTELNATTKFYFNSMPIKSSSLFTCENNLSKTILITSEWIMCDGGIEYDNAT